MTLATPTVDGTARAKSLVGEHISARQIPCGITHPSIPSNRTHLHRGLLRHGCVSGGKRYVVLRNTKGVLAVYRVRNDGILKGLRRWPAALEEGW
jgi:hypothetical protein